MSYDSEIAGAFSLAGKVAVITGAASGLGQEAARIFAHAGARVVLADIDTAGLESTTAIVREAGGVAFSQPVNVTNPDEMEALGEACVREFGQLDSWINSAGISFSAGVMETSPAEVQRLVSINMLGTYWGCVSAGRIMQKLGRGGTIINVSSTAGDSPVPSLATYGMTKAAVNQLTRCCAMEFGPFGVRVNAVVPGWIDTPINARMYKDANSEVNLQERERVIAQMAALSPLGLTGEPSDIGLALLYLASDASRFVTGHLLRVSGGV